jgi:hypothetical protein
VRDLSHADIGIGQHRLGGLDVVIREFRRPATGAATAAYAGAWARPWRSRAAVARELRRVLRAAVWILRQP